MAAQTQVQRNRSYRQRRAEKMAALVLVAEEATAALLERDAGGTTLATWGRLRHAIAALNPGKETGE